MNNIDRDTLKNILSSVDIVDIIGNYIPLITRGKNFFCVCPFHDDSNPSMSVSKQKQIYTCFSCGATGNAFNFLMNYENISFKEAVKKCADKAGIDIKINIKSLKDNTKYQTLYDIYELSSKFYQNNINTSAGAKARKYLSDRLIDENIIKEFGIGLALKERDLLTKLLINKKYSQNDLMKSGLITENNYDIYYNRIMFPIENLTGNIVGFSGRIYGGEDLAKYINTRETEIFKKGEILYNYSRAKNTARAKGYVIVMEGFMDVIRAYSIGIKNVVATMGTAVTKNQALAIKKMAKEVYICFDGDDAGAKATMSCIDELLKIGVMPKIIRLEDNMDPDDYIQKNGQERFLAKINNPINVMDFKLSYLKKDKNVNDSDDLANYVNQIIKELSKINDEVLKEITLKKVSLESNLDIEFLKQRLDSVVIKSKDLNLSTKKNPRIKKTGCELAESYLIYYMLQSKEVIKLYKKKIGSLPSERYRSLANEICEYYNEENDTDIASFMTYLGNNNDMSKILGEILLLNLPDKCDLVKIESYVKTIRDHMVKEHIKRLEARIKSITEPLEQAKIADEIIKIRLENSDDIK